MELGVRPMLVLLGGGGHAAVVADAARAAEHWDIAGYLDDRQPDDASQRLPGLNYLGVIGDLPTIEASMDAPIIVHAAVGDPALRRRWGGRYRSFERATVVHPSAIVSPHATIEPGAFIGPRAVVNARAHIGESTIINSGAIVEHDCSIGPYVHIAPGAVLCGAVSVHAEALVGAGAIVTPGLAIGPSAVIGAGSVVVESVDANCTVSGSPARLHQPAPGTGRSPAQSAPSTAPAWATA